MHMSGGKEIANRQYRRRVNAGVFDEYPHHARAAYKRIGIDQYEMSLMAFCVILGPVFKPKLK